MQNEASSRLRNKHKLLTITQAAEFLKVSPDTLRRWEEKGIVIPARTKGGSRRYTLLDLKIAKLNKQSLRSDLKQSLRSNDLKRKTRFLQISNLLRANSINSRHDLKIAALTSFLWIFGLLIYYFLTPIFLRPTNPEQQIVSDIIKGQARLKIASQTPSKIGAIKALTVPGPAEDSISSEITSKAISPGSGLLIGKSGNLPALKYTDTLDQYYYLKPLPRN